MKNQHPNEKEQVELPKSLKSNRFRNYSPQNNLLDGYAQLPRQYCSPYANHKLLTKTDFSRRKRSIDQPLRTTLCR